MCNDYGNRIPVSEYSEAFSDIRLPLTFPTGAPNLEPRDDIWPTETAPVVRRTPEGAELVQLRWGFDPGRPKAPPVINFRSDGRRFNDSRRCLIPASHFFEFTGTKSPKSKWKFTKTGEDWFCFAGLWRPAVGATPEAFNILQPPGASPWPLRGSPIRVRQARSTAATCAVCWTEPLCCRSTPSTC